MSRYLAANGYKPGLFYVKDNDESRLITSGTGKLLKFTELGASLVAGFLNADWTLEEALNVLTLAAEVHGEILQH